MAGKQTAEKGWNSGETGEWRRSGAEAPFVPGRFEQILRLARDDKQGQRQRQGQKQRQRQKQILHFVQDDKQGQRQGQRQEQILCVPDDKRRQKKGADLDLL